MMGIALAPQVRPSLLSILESKNAKIQNALRRRNIYDNMQPSIAAGCTTFETIVTKCSPLF
jgi:hypothetical protein